jgi:hypothetical protein
MEKVLEEVCEDSYVKSVLLLLLSFLRRSNPSFCGK